MYFLRYSVVALMFEWTPCLWCCAGQPNLHSPSNIGSVKYYFFCTFWFFFTLHRYSLWIRVIMADPTLFQSTPSLRFLLSGLRISCDWSNTGLTFSSDMWVDPLLMMLCRATQSPLSLHVLVLVLSPRTPFWTHFYFFWCVTRTHFLYLFNFFVYSQSILHKYVTSLTTPFPSLIYEWTPSLCCYSGQPNIHSPSMC